jgi:D-alanine-D-alanine ligase
MRIGITYDLRDDYLAMGYGEEETGEFDRADTIVAIDEALRSLGHATDRVGHVRNLVGRLATGERWDLVFNIAEGLKGFAREAQIPALLEAYEIPCTFSDAMVLGFTLHKGICKRIVRDLGIPTPDFVVVETEQDIDRVQLACPLFAKPVAEGTGKGITAGSRILAPEGLAPLCLKLLAQYKQPVLVETFLPGREFTVSIIGTGAAAEAIGTDEVILLRGAEEGVYSYYNKEECEKVVDYKLVRPSDPAVCRAEEIALATWRGLGCRDAGRVDLRTDAAGAPQFLEVNPLAGLHPQHSDLPILCQQVGISYRELIRRIIESAQTRVAG